jgi:transcription elongation factor GreA
MVNNDDHVPTLGQGAARFLATLSAVKKEASQPEVYKFARWYGWDSPFSRLLGHAVERYAEQMSVSDTEYTGKLDLVRSFLAYAKKSGWTRTNLSTHLKTKKGKSAPVTAAGKRGIRETISLTQQRYDEMVAEVNALKERSRALVGEIQRAAADKDFRENAPLQAAREERGHVEGRIKELQEALKVATIIEEKKEPAVKTIVGDSVILEDLASGEELRYTIVDPREIDPANGKISIASPLGKALLGRKGGETVEIKAPAGRLRYRIKQVER